MQPTKILCKWILIMFAMVLSIFYLISSIMIYILLINICILVISFDLKFICSTIYNCKLTAFESPRTQLAASVIRLE